MTGLLVENIHKSFGSTPALGGVSFEIEKGMIMAVLGPSGCGKSTLLSIIAGLETADEGTVYWDSQPVKNVPTHKRGFGLMFQDYMLFPHKNVYANVAFGLEMLQWEKERIDQRVAKILAFVGLPGYGSRDVNTLSGGEQQRIALARSLAPHPRLLMLDEPLSSLDRSLGDRLLHELRDILKQMNQTALYVTHDQEEAFTLADQVVVMNHGRVAQIGTPEAIYKEPATEFVARFLGFRNIFTGVIVGDTVHLPIGKFPIQITPTTKDPREVTVLLRPDSVAKEGINKCHIEGTIRERSFRGTLCQLVVVVDGIQLAFEFPSRSYLPIVGEPIKLDFDPREAIQVLK